MAFRGHAVAGSVLLLWASAVIPAERLLVLPMELETDRGADNGDATLLRVMPGYNWALNEDWEIVNLDLILLADAPGGVPGTPMNPEPIRGHRASGLSDWIHASFFSRTDEPHVDVGVGFMVSVPTAADRALGSGKWAIGPALRGAWTVGSWRIGAFGGQRWSFAGRESRADISQLLIRPTILYEPGSSWFLVSSPIITANWRAARADRWMVPVGGGVGRRFNPAGNEWRASLQLYGNAIRPDGAPHWFARVALTAVVSI